MESSGRRSLIGKETCDAFSPLCEMNMTPNYSLCYPCAEGLRDERCAKHKGAAAIQRPVCISQ